MSLYSRPEVYDLAFSWDPEPEVSFYLHLFERYAGEVRRVLELGCGTCRLLLEMAKRGLECVGLDISREMVGYSRKVAARRGVSLTVILGDMANFDLRGFDAAFSALNTVAGLGTRERLLSHYRSVARALRPGGVYVVDAGVGLTVGDREEWEVKRGRVRASVRWAVLSSSPTEVEEEIAVHIHSPSEEVVAERGRGMRLSPEDLSDLPRLAGLEPVTWFSGIWGREFPRPPERGRCVAVLKRPPSDPPMVPPSWPAGSTGRRGLSGR